MTDICKIPFLMAGSPRLVLLGGGQAPGHGKRDFSSSRRAVTPLHPQHTPTPAARRVRGPVNCSARSAPRRPLAARQARRRSARARARRGGARPRAPCAARR